jgi:hypothetical protein
MPIYYSSQTTHGTLPNNIKKIIMTFCHEGTLINNNNYYYSLFLCVLKCPKIVQRNYKYLHFIPDSKRLYTIYYHTVVCSSTSQTKCTFTLISEATTYCVARDNILTRDNVLTNTTYCKELSLYGTDWSLLRCCIYYSILNNACHI